MSVEKDIDLRHYINILLQRRRIIISLTLFTTIVAGIFSVIMPPPFNATVSVAIIKTKPDLVFDPNFKTVSAEDLAIAGAAQALSSEARRTALIGLVQDPSVKLVRYGKAEPKDK